MNSSLLSNAIFKEAILDIEALGLLVTEEPRDNAVCYAVIGGRSNSRWWLIPLTNTKVTYSGFSLFQPLINSAQILKTIVLCLIQIGLSGLWARNKLYISGHSVLEQYFPHSKQLSYAYFTGTDSPHRKLAVQMMDDQGNIKGYAKVSRNPQVQSLLKHETDTLHYVKTLNLQTAHTPNIVFSGQHQQVYVLVTDTLKTPKTKSVTKLTQLHVDFLNELAQKTTNLKKQDKNWPVKQLAERYLNIHNKLPEEWKQRIDKAFKKLNQSECDFGQPIFAHGDFTPWNTFIADKKLYVFDWEYSAYESTRGYDEVHYLFNLVRTQVSDVSEIFNRLGEQKINEASKPKFIYYLLGQVLFQLERMQDSEKILTWDSSDKLANFLDCLLNNKQT